MKKEMIEKVRNFVEEVKAHGKFEGCWFLRLDAKYNVVFAYYGDEGLCGKVAYNSDDLQCDYDFDWYMPENASGDVLDSEVTECMDVETNELVEHFCASYEEYLRFAK